MKAGQDIIARNDRNLFLELASPQRTNKICDSKCSNEERVFAKITEVIKTTDKIYEEDFNTRRLAILVGESQSAVSEAIMAVSKETTMQFLTRIRIREACRRINDRENYGDYTTEAIGQSVGYRSRSHFGSVFKKIVGMTPSEYISKINNIHS